MDLKYLTYFYHKAQLLVLDSYNFFLIFFSFVIQIEKLQQ